MLAHEFPIEFVDGFPIATFFFWLDEKFSSKGTPEASTLRHAQLDG